MSIKFSDSTFRMFIFVSLYIYERKQFELHVERCFTLLFNKWMHFIFYFFIGQLSARYHSIT